MTFSSGQKLNGYAEMLHGIYGPGQNYAKTKYEILCHLSEVCGVAGKHIVKKADYVSAERFLPKIFGWICALVKSVSAEKTDLEAAILRKYPGACPYCLESKCSCWSREKPTLQPDRISSLFGAVAPQHRRTIDDFNVMFRTIYEHTWRGRNNDQDPITYCYVRLIEELAEVSEAVRFYHLYPENFENEVADLISWWFALGQSLMDRRGVDASQTSDMLWRAYPGHCKDCESSPCFCPQGPVRELMSKPSPSAHGEVDALTSLRNQAAYKKDIVDLVSGNSTLVYPAVCVRADVDLFKKVNDLYGHAAGDEALKHIATLMRGKVRPKDRVYRVSGDEFGILMPDFSEQEAVGLISRVIKALQNNQVIWISADGDEVNFAVSLSFGVAECAASDDLNGAFERADLAAYESKERGGNQVTSSKELKENG